MCKYLIKFVQGRLEDNFEKKNTKGGKNDLNSPKLKKVKNMYSAFVYYVHERDKQREGEREGERGEKPSWS